ncbi:uncharacterized protein LOC106137566 isoform X3 [Amyelois transitella]|uniref:uncharacterized protein LOC106137566 isoform X2 n=1 Tax=Amyelois transitella TaxID=680683 RepID=UPI00067E0FF8|nr:uncharacterized protein LOC106137566 isoform X2 [Amyelois transitella]XP_060804975.1 uncharacterized protein LOC106137566 isoform X3 [Amyelois transitella]
MQKLRCLILLSVVVSVVAAPKLFHSEKFRIGIEYENSLPMYGGSDRYRHRNNYEPFFVTVTATAKDGFVITYLDVSATVDDGGEVTFNMVRGQTGSRSMVFQLISNHSDFLSYSYLTYGIREEEYRKVTSVSMGIYG